MDNVVLAISICLCKLYPSSLQLSNKRVRVIPMPILHLLSVTDFNVSNNPSINIFKRHSSLMVNCRLSAM